MSINQDGRAGTRRSRAVQVITSSSGSEEESSGSGQDSAVRNARWADSIEGCEQMIKSNNRKMRRCYIRAKTLEERLTKLEKGIRPHFRSTRLHIIL